MCHKKDDLMTPSEIIERIAILETQVKYLEKENENRTSREHWVIGTLVGVGIALAGIIVSILH